MRTVHTSVIDNVHTCIFVVDRWHFNEYLCHLTEGDICKCVALIGIMTWFSLFWALTCEIVILMANGKDASLLITE